MTNSAFGSPSKNDIRVAYVSLLHGLVTNVSVNDANIYAQKNPGTVFIFKDGSNQIQYLNINQVNQLTPENLISSKTCEGFQSIQSTNVPPKIDFVGGEGIGAIANPIIGNDGSLMAVDLIDGGYGYQYAPQVIVSDVGNTGSGAVISAEIGNTVQIQNLCDYSIEEEYQIDVPEEINYEKVYGPNGEELGYWNPSTYTSIRQTNPQKEQNQTQQNFLKITNPFWTSRSTDSRITEIIGLKNYSAKYTISNSYWNDFMNSYAVSPVSESSKKYKNLFVLEWNVEFPYDGEYVFRGLCEKYGKLFLDDLYLFDLKNSRDFVNPYVKTMSAGKHNIRVDLKNYEPKNNFTSTDFIQRANQQLSRLSPDSKYKSSFLYEYGVVPSVNSEIRWNNVNFPSDGNYIIRATGNCNLKIVVDSYEIRTEKLQEYSQVYYFSSGNYDISVEPENILDADPAVAISIFYSPFEEFAFSSDTPIGVSLSIDAPNEPSSTGISVNENKTVTSNLIWTTRDPSGTNSWYSVTYNQNEKWSDFMNLYGLSPIQVTEKSDSRVYQNSWTINAPHSGYYGLRTLGSDGGKIFIDDQEIADLEKTNIRTPKIEKVYLEAGSHKIRIELYSNDLQIPWNQNPLGVSASLVYCRKQIQGKGTITKVVVLDPGNGYYSPGFASTSITQTPQVPSNNIDGIVIDSGIPQTIFPEISSLSSNGYPVILQLTEVLILNGGIRYNANVDRIQVIPDNGTQLSFSTDNFGIVKSVTVQSPGTGFTEYPKIIIRSETGINFSAIPLFTVIRDPVNLIGISSTTLLQVTDLVGIKKTGYIDGRPFYGSVYYENGSKYAGPYKTPGTPIRVYDTLQESILKMTQGPPSAIQKLGSYTNSNSSLF